MRISDWSSDVCSSDLHLGGVVFGCRHFEHVGQVVLALRVVDGQALQPALERHRVGGKDAGVDGADVALFLGGVLVFDDGADAAFRVAHDAAVAGRVLEIGAQHRDAADGGQTNGRAPGTTP